MASAPEKSRSRDAFRVETVEFSGGRMTSATYLHDATTSARRTPLADYADYADAQRAVDFLADEKFPVEKLDIVGRDLYLVERISGRLTLVRAAVAGAGSGVWIGVLFGLLFGLFATTTASFFAVVVSGLGLGLVLGAMFGALAYAFARGRRDFISRSSIVASRYEVLADPDVAENARVSLARLS
jgi:hypothetical protein